MAANDATVDTDAEDLTTCSICFNEYEENGSRQPKFLPCSHTFCFLCLQTMLNSSDDDEDDSQNDLSCPLCRNEIEDVGEAEDLPTNKFAISIIKLRKKYSPKKLPASIPNWCLTCKMFSQFNCFNSENHSLVPMSRNETVQQAQELQQQIEILLSKKEQTCQDLSAQLLEYEPILKSLLQSVTIVQDLNERNQKRTSRIRSFFTVWPQSNITLQGLKENCEKLNELMDESKQTVDTLNKTELLNLIGTIHENLKNSWGNLVKLPAEEPLAHSASKIRRVSEEPIIVQPVVKCEVISEPGQSSSTNSTVSHIEPEGTVALSAGGLAEWYRVLKCLMEKAFQVQREESTSELIQSMIDFEIPPLIALSQLRMELNLEDLDLKMLKTSTSGLAELRRELSSGNMHLFGIRPNFRC